MKNILKTTVLSLFLVVGIFAIAPSRAHALFLDSLFEDAPFGPHCLMMDCNGGSNSQPSAVYNYTNSNNTNSFNNTTSVGTNYGAVSAPYSVSGSTNSGSSGYIPNVNSGYLPPAHVPNLVSNTSVVVNPSTAPSSNSNYNYNYNVNGGTSYVPAPVYYSQPTYYPQPTYYYTPTYQTPIYQQPTYYNQPITYAPSFQVACAADATSARVGTQVTWSAEAVLPGYSGGFSYSWSGTEGLFGSQPSTVMTYYSTGVKSATVTVIAPNGQSLTKACTNTVTVKSNTVAKAPVKAAPVHVVAAPEQVTAASLFSLGNVPWGWVGILIILMLIGIIFYLIFNKKKI